MVGHMVVNHLFVQQVFGDSDFYLTLRSCFSAVVRVLLDVRLVIGSGGVSLVLVGKQFSEAAPTGMQRIFQFLHLLQPIVEVVAVAATFVEGGSLLGHSVGVVRRLLLEALVLELDLLNKCLVHVVRVDLDHARLLPVGQEVLLQLVLSNLVFEHIEKLVVSLLQKPTPADSRVLMK